MIKIQENVTLFGKIMYIGSYIMVESQCLVLCGDGWKRWKELLGEGLFLRKFENDVGANESSPFFVGGGRIKQKGRVYYGQK
jgi:hypothetical protein